MYRDWPFFRTLLSNMDMVLAKSDLAIAARYAELVRGQRSCGQRIFGRIDGRVAAHARARSRAITGEQELPRRQPALARSIRARFPYLDPLNHLQVELLRRYRAGDREPRLRAGST